MLCISIQILENEIQSEFVDLNSACPIDLVCNRGCGSALMTKTNRLFEIVDAMTKQLRSRSVTIKIRTGWNEKAPIAHELIPQLQTRFNGKLSAIMVSFVFYCAFTTSQAECILKFVLTPRAQILVIGKVCI